MMLTALGQMLVASEAQKGDTSPAPVVHAPASAMERWHQGALEYKLNEGQAKLSEEFFTQRQAVGMSQDLQRVLALPRRSPEPPPGIADEVTERFRRPGGTMSLKPAQAMAIDEAGRYGHLLSELPVGTGKTLVLALAPMAMKSRSALLFVPSSCVDQVVRMFAEYGKHFRVPNVLNGAVFYPDVDCTVRVIGYGEWCNKSGAALPEKLAPLVDTVLVDECHRFAGSSTQTKRFKRLFKINPRLRGRCVDVSGTIFSRSVMDITGLASTALGYGSPVPLSYPVARAWADALDPDPRGFEAPPGELVALCEPGESAREGFQRRLRETPAVVIPTVPGIRASLYFHKREVAVPEEVHRQIKNLVDTWCTSWGEELVTALDMHRYLFQLSAGMNYRRDWPMGEPQDLRDEWLESRGSWNRVVREWLDTPAPGMDSPELCAIAAARWDALEAAYPLKRRRHTVEKIRAWLRKRGAPAKYASQWAPWSDVRFKCKPRQAVVWYSDFLAKDAAAWGREHRGIIWTEHRALARKISDLGGFPAYVDPDVDQLFDLERKCREDGSRTIILSRRAYGEGTDGLQRVFSKQLFTSLPPGGGKAFEQLAGRLHREGQTADEVQTWIYAHTPEVVKAYRKLFESAKFLETLTGKPQKALYGTWSFSP
jgi:hypothetical protein